MPQTYAITAPNGKTLEVTGDHIPTEAELHAIFKGAGVEIGAAPAGDPEPDTYAGGFARSALDTAKQTGAGILEGLNPITAAQGVAQTIAHPIDAVTGLASSVAHPIDTLRALSDPRTGGRAIGNLILGGATGRIAPVASATARAAAPAIRAVAESPVALKAAARLVKHGSTVAGVYLGGAPGAILGSEIGSEMSGLMLKRLAVVLKNKVPAGVAPEVFAEQELAAGHIPAAVLKNVAHQAELEAATPAATEAVARPPRPTLVPRPPPVAEPVAPAALTSDPTRASGAALPDQKALNDAALAVRRATYQASQGKPVPVSQVVKAVATAAKDAKLKLTGAETTAAMDLIKRGMPGEDALKAIVTQREFLAAMKGSLPTAREAAAAIKAKGYKS